MFSNEQHPYTRPTGRFVPDDGQGPPPVGITDDACSFQKPLGACRLEGKKAVITGADRGIGRSTAIRFALEGAEVFIAYLAREKKVAHVTQKLIESYGKVCHLFAMDIDHKDKCKRIIDEAVFVMGGINIVFNNAPYQRMTDTEHEVDRVQFTHTYKTEIHPYYYLVKYAIPHLKFGDSIINNASGHTYLSPADALDYAATRHAVSRLTGDLARQYDMQGLRVNCIYEGNIVMDFPDWVMEKMTSDEIMNAKGIDDQPDQIAGVVTFLASKDSACINGHTLTCTGNVDHSKYDLKPYRQV